MNNIEKISVYMEHNVPQKVLSLLEDTDYSDNFQKLLLIDYYLDDEINNIEDFHTYINSPSVVNEFTCYSTDTVKLSSKSESIELKQYQLDSVKNKSVPFEVALFDTINFSGSLNENWVDITNNRLKECIVPGLRGKFDGFSIYKLSVDIVNRFNNHLEYFLNKNVRSFVKIKEVNIISFEDNIFIGGIRFQFKNRQLSLQDVMGILTKLPHMRRKTDKKRNYFLTKRGIFSPCEFIKKIFSEVLDGTCSFQNKRARRMAFIRTEKCIFTDQNVCQSIFSRFATFNDHVSESANESGFESIPLDYDTILSISEKGSVALCGSAPKCNSDFLPDEFMKYYFLNYLINWYGQLSNNKFDNLFQRKYLNLYSEAAYNRNLF